MATADPPKPGLVERLQAQRERHRQRPLVIRVLSVWLGFALLLAGLVMLVLPGPAFVVIPIGLALLSLEFMWAQGLLNRAVTQGEIAKRRAAETTTTQRIISAVVFVLGTAALVAWAILGDIPLLPV